MSFKKSIQQIWKRKLLKTVSKTRLDAARFASKKLVHKTAEATGELRGNKLAEKIVTPKPIPGTNLRNVEEKLIPSEKREETLNKLWQAL